MRISRAGAFGSDRDVPSPVSKGRAARDARAICRPRAPQRRRPRSTSARAFHADGHLDGRRPRHRGAARRPARGRDLPQGARPPRLRLVFFIQALGGTSEPATRTLGSASIARARSPRSPVLAPATDPPIPDRSPRTPAGDRLRVRRPSPLRVRARAVAEPSAPSATKRVFRFGNGTADGDASMKSLLGGKGANLAEMSSIGLSVPAGFTVTTEVCAQFHENAGELPRGAGTR